MGTSVYHTNRKPWSYRGRLLLVLLWWVVFILGTYYWLQCLSWTHLPYPDLSWEVGHVKVVLDAPRRLSPNDFDPLSITMQRTSAEFGSASFRLVGDGIHDFTLPDGASTTFYSDTLPSGVKGEAYAGKPVQPKFLWPSKNNEQILDAPAGLSLRGRAGSVSEGTIAELPLRFAPFPLTRFAANNLHYALGIIGTPLIAIVVRSILVKKQRGQLASRHVGPMKIVTLILTGAIMVLLVWFLVIPAIKDLFGW